MNDSMVLSSNSGSSRQNRLSEQTLDIPDRNGPLPLGILTDLLAEGVEVHGLLVVVEYAYQQLFEAQAFRKKGGDGIDDFFLVQRRDDGQPDLFQTQQLDVLLHQLEASFFQLGGQFLKGIENHAIDVPAADLAEILESFELDVADALEDGLVPPLFPAVDQGHMRVEDGGGQRHEEVPGQENGEKREPDRIDSEVDDKLSGRHHVPGTGAGIQQAGFIPFGANNIPNAGSRL
jgi:hypothetical protein